MVENSAAEWRGLTGGQNGIMGVKPPDLFGTAFGERGVALLAIGLNGINVLNGDPVGSLIHPAITTIGYIAAVT